jgi:peptidyl-prolyl cis-trans isomerase-like 1
MNQNKVRSMEQWSTGRIFRTTALAALVTLSTASRLLAQNEPVVTHRAVISTTEGNINIELYGNDAPKTVENFMGLVNKGFYRGLRFHRVVKGFVIQTGDPSSKDTTKKLTWGRGGTSIYNGRPFADELSPNAPSYKRGYLEGTLAMANRGPNTNTSQFFIILGNNVKLPKLYTIFGRVTVGDTTDHSLDVVHTIERGPLADVKTGLPVAPIVIVDIKEVALPQPEPKKE